MKWLIMAALTLALMFVCVFLVINKQEQLGVITKEVQTYMGQRETLQKEVENLQGIRDREVALDKAWADCKTKEGELKGKYGEKKELEGECSKLKERNEALRVGIKAHEEQKSSLEGKLVDLVNQTNYLGKTMTKMLGERDSILEDTKRFKAQCREAEERYAAQKKLADQAAERATKEKKRADDAKNAADEAERRKEDAERAIESVLNSKKARIAAAREEADKEVEKQNLRKSTANKEAVEAHSKVEAQEEKLKALLAEIVQLEARRFELMEVTNQLAEAKVLLNTEQKKLSQTQAEITEQQIATRLAALLNGVAKRLDAFESKLNDFEKKDKQKEEVNQGGQE